MSRTPHVQLLFYSLFAPLLIVVVAQAGSLTPPGAPAATMKTLDEVEARTPIGEDDLPLMITSSGSYYLKESCSFLLSDTNAITIAANDVSIDLNGFSLTGPGMATGSTGHGIATASAATNVTVRGGSLSRWREYGVYLSPGVSAHVYGINASANGKGGIRTGANSLVHDNVCSYNGSEESTETVYGIYASSRSNVRNNVTAYNKGGTTYGLYADYGALIRNNTCNNNYAYVGKGAGIYAGEQTTVSENVCNSNGSFADSQLGAGIYAGGSGCTIRNNACYSNNAGDGGTGYGIYAYYDCYVIGNKCQYNGSSVGRTQVQIYGHARCTITKNYCVSSASGTRYGIWLNSQKAVVTENVLRVNLNGSIYINSSCDGVFYAGNIMDYAVSDNGVNTTSGTLDGSNIIY
jgi:hypothetical protein